METKLVDSGEFHRKLRQIGWTRITVSEEKWIEIRGESPPPEKEIKMALAHLWTPASESIHALKYQSFDVLLAGRFDSEKPVLAEIAKRCMSFWFREFKEELKRQQNIMGAGLGDGRISMGIDAGDGPVNASTALQSIREMVGSLLHRILRGTIFAYSPKGI